MESTEVWLTISKIVGTSCRKLIFSSASIHGYLGTTWTHSCWQNSIIIIIDGAGDACFGQIFRIFGVRHLNNIIMQNITIKAENWCQTIIFNIMYWIAWSLVHKILATWNLLRFDGQIQRLVVLLTKNSFSVQRLYMAILTLHERIPVDRIALSWLLMVLEMLALAGFSVFLMFEI